MADATVIDDQTRGARLEVLTAGAGEPVLLVRSAMRGAADFSQLRRHLTNGPPTSRCPDAATPSRPNSPTPSPRTWSRSSSGLTPSIGCVRLGGERARPRGARGPPDLDACRRYPPGVGVESCPDATVGS